MSAPLTLEANLPGFLQGLLVYDANQPPAPGRRRYCVIVCECLRWAFCFDTDDESIVEELAERLWDYLQDESIAIVTVPAITGSAAAVQAGTR